MRIAALIAVHNAENYIGAAIDSLLCQSLPPAQVIIADDGSSDQTPQVLAGFGDRIVVLRQPNRGQATALNRAIAHASGDALAFCDADDLWCANKLELQATALQADPQLDNVFGYVRQFVSPDVPDAMKTSLAPGAEVLRGECKQSLLIRRASFDRIGPFDEALPSTFFMEWLGRAKRAGMKSRMLDDVILLRRIHLANGGRLRKSSQDEETLQALWQNIRERRSRLP